MNFIYTLRDRVETDIFTMGELKALFCPPMSETALINKVARANELIRLKRGLYLFPKQLRQQPLSPFSVANKLYSPSYISFESALSHHGLIPETVHTVTSACAQRKNKMFHNDLGAFSFDHVPSRPFFEGIRKEDALIAHPLKALFDLLCIRRKKYDSLDALEEDWRISRKSLKEEVAGQSVQEIKSLADSYKKNNVKNFYRILIEELK